MTAATNQKCLPCLRESPDETDLRAAGAYSCVHWTGACAKGGEMLCWTAHTVFIVTRWPVLAWQRESLWRTLN